MTVVGSAVDPVEAVRAWINAQAALVGAGNVLPLGAHRWREKSPGQGAYALIVAAGGGLDPTEAPMMNIRVGAQIYAGTEAAARRAADGYLDLLASLDYLPPQTVTWPDGTAVIEAVDQITGPTPIASTGEAAFLVDAVFYLHP